MGEKRAYKARKPGGGRKKQKPEYDAGKNLKEQMESAVALYDSEMSLQAIGEELRLNQIKVRKLLITAGVYESEVAKKVQDTFEEYRETQDYGIYKKHKTEKMIEVSNRDYLLCRDLTSVNIIILIMYLGLSVVLQMFTLKWKAIVFLAFMYIISMIAARIKAQRFVLNVIAEDVC